MAKRELSDREIKDFRKAFKLFDKNGDKGLSKKEMALVILANGLDATEKSMDLIWESLDKHDEERISFDEFLEAMRDFCFPPETDILAAFKLFDRDKNGYISKEELSIVMTTMGEILSDAELQEMFEEADVNADGKIDYTEFTKILCE